MIELNSTIKNLINTINFQIAQDDFKSSEMYDLQSRLNRIVTNETNGLLSVKFDDYKCTTGSIVLNGVENGTYAKQRFLFVVKISKTKKDTMSYWYNYATNYSLKKISVYDESLNPETTLSELNEKQIQQENAIQEKKQQKENDMIEFFKSYGCNFNSMEDIKEFKNAMKSSGFYSTFLHLNIY